MCNTSMMDTVETKHKACFLVLQWTYRAVWNAVRVPRVGWTTVNTGEPLVDHYIGSMLLVQITHLRLQDLSSLKKHSYIIGSSDSSTEFGL